MLLLRCGGLLLDEQLGTSVLHRVLVAVQLRLGDCNIIVGPLREPIKGPGKRGDRVRDQLDRIVLDDRRKNQPRKETSYQLGEGFTFVLSSQAVKLRLATPSQRAW